MTDLIELMAACVKTRRFQEATDFVESRETRADRDEARTALLGAYLDYGYFGSARIVASQMEDGETTVDALLAVADMTQSPDDEDDARTEIRSGRHSHLCRAEHFLALYRRSRDPEDLKAARRCERVLSLN